MAASHLAVFLGFFFWEQSDFARDGVAETARNEVLDAMRKRWAASDRSSIPLGVIPR